MEKDIKTIYELFEWVIENKPDFKITSDKLPDNVIKYIVDSEIEQAIQNNQVIGREEDKSFLFDISGSAKDFKRCLSRCYYMKWLKEDQCKPGEKSRLYFQNSTFVWVSSDNKVWFKDESKSKMLKGDEWNITEPSCVLQYLDLTDKKIRQDIESIIWTGLRDPQKIYTLKELINNKMNGLYSFYGLVKDYVEVYEIKRHRNQNSYWSSDYDRKVFVFYDGNQVRQYNFSNEEIKY